MMDHVTRLRAIARSGRIADARTVLADLTAEDRVRTVRLARQMAENERQQACAPVAASGAPIDSSTHAAELDVLDALETSMR